MTQDEIIDMARDSGMELYGLGKNRARFVHHLEAFANLVAQEVRDRIMFGSRDDWVLAEREACAKVCEELYAEDETVSVGECVNAIRARGEQA
jgi:hypothetical protein